MAMLDLQNANVVVLHGGFLNSAVYAVGMPIPIEMREEAIELFEIMEVMLEAELVSDYDEELDEFLEVAFD